MKLKLLAGAALAALGVATAASAEPDGWYGAIDLGYHWPQGIEADSSGVTQGGGNYDWEWGSDDDWTAFGRLGYRFNPSWRTELELGFRPGDIDSVNNGGGSIPAALCSPEFTTPTSACGSPDGEIESWTLMANLIYDFLPDSRFRPFIGVGIGVNRMDINANGVLSTSPTGSPAPAALTIDDDDTTFAWQGLVGFAWAWTDRLNLDLTYRWLDGNDTDFNSTISPAGGPGVGFDAFARAPSRATTRTRR